MTTTSQTWTAPDRDNMIYGLRFGTRYGNRLARFFSRIAMGSRFLLVLSGTAAFTSAIGDVPMLMKVSGVAVAVLTAFDLVVDPAKLASRCIRQAERFLELERKAPTLTDNELNAQLQQVTDGDIPSIDGLRVLVANDVLREFGRQDAVTEPGRWPKALRFMM